MKKCSKCKIEKTKLEFSKKGENRLQSVCKLCTREMVRNHYKNNKNYYKNRNKNRREECAKFVLEYLKIHPCVDCGERDPIVLEFDHIDRSLKEKDVSKLIRSSTLPRLKREIDKCEVRCANCHKRKTAHQFNWYKCGE